MYLPSQSHLVLPHGGKLVNRLVPPTQKQEMQKYASSLFKITLSEELVMDVDKIAIGAYSPLEGFMTQKDFKSVADRMRLANNIPWTLPVILDLESKTAAQIKKGQEIGLREKGKGKPFAILKVEDIYRFNRKAMARKIFGTLDPNHPGVARALLLNPVLIGGKILLITRPHFPFSALEMTPGETRDFFEQRGLATVTGFHTRNAIHRAHEYLQRCSLEITDGLLVHPVVGKKKKGDFTAGAIVASYQAMRRSYYPRERVLFSVVSTYSRYAGPREAIFTALLRKNYGCSHFIVGRDHTGVGNYYDVYASHRIFDQLGDTLGIIPLRFHEPLWCSRCGQITTEKTCHHHRSYQQISGTLIRELLAARKKIPQTMLRPEVSRALLAYGKKYPLFVE